MVKLKRKVIVFIFLLVSFNILDIILDLAWEIAYQGYIISYLEGKGSKVNFCGFIVHYAIVIDTIRIITIVMNILSVFFLLYLLINRYSEENKQLEFMITISKKSEVKSC